MSVAQLLALGQPYGLLTDVFMVAHRRGEGKGEALTLCLTQCARLFEALFGVEGKSCDRLTAGKDLLFRVLHQLDEAMPFG